MNTCSECGLNHQVLNVEVGGGLLFRRVRGAQHRLRLFGGSWGFSEQLIKMHLSEIQRVQVLDESTNELFECSWRTLVRESVRRVLDPRAGMQLILPLRFWSVTNLQPEAAPSTDGAEQLPEIEPPEIDEQAERAAQLRFVLPRVPNAIFDRRKRARRR